MTELCNIETILTILQVIRVFIYIYIETRLSPGYLYFTSLLFWLFSYSHMLKKNAQYLLKNCVE